MRSVLPSAREMTDKPLHPLWRPYEQPSLEQLERAHVSGKRPTLPNNTIIMSPPRDEWAGQYELLAGKVRAALGAHVLALEHVGSTSVPGLYAKPVIDMDLTVADSSDEDAYAHDLEKAGFTLIIREPDWEEHRNFIYNDPRCNLHVFSLGAVEPRRHIAFRNWLITHDDDRQKYADLKRQLAQKSFESTMAYNNEKSALIYEIYERIFANDPRHPHTPQPI